MTRRHQYSTLSMQQPNYLSTWRLEPHHCLSLFRHPRIKVNPDAFVILTFFWLQVVSLTIRGVCSRTPRARRVDTVFHSKQSLSAIKVLANGYLLVNRITESEKQRVWTKAVYPPPTKKSGRPQQAGILLIDVTATVRILTYYTVLVYSGVFAI